MWPYLKKLNPQAEETHFGHIVALYSIGQCICAPSFGYWSNRIEQIRLPLLAGFSLMMAGNVLYLSLQFFSPSHATIAMAFARFISGCGTVTMCFANWIVYNVISRSIEESETADDQLSEYLYSKNLIYG
ncbi:hypothetical protein KIN20_023119 [Parelaphostrongylus tenuis]|uniref:Major facilitator superfamily (MFS) profile domain-containing protein n=1 Tax=Parelaphostrongylus tenuis TaxID=148309 RepID=A0AAD5QVU3_PARTN|nr:hypothetical protein KIN20_023119 [Parelaphostrongylus tenuis]